MGKHNKEPQNHQTKAEALRDLRANPEFQKRMSFVREQFYPALIEASTSIDDASTLLSGFNNVMMEKFLGIMKEKKVSELGLYERLDQESPKIEEHKRLLDLFQDMNVFDAKSYIEGMKDELETFKLDEMKERPLSSLKTRWLDEL